MIPESTFGPPGQRAAVERVEGALRGRAWAATELADAEEELRAAVYAAVVDAGLDLRRFERLLPSPA